MNYFDNQTAILLAAVAALILGSLYCWQIFYLRDKFKRREEEIKRHLYELTILKELGDRVGYSLNIPNIIDVICGSLNQFIKFSAVASLVVEPDKIVFKINLAEPVAKEFVAEVRERMRQSLGALLNKTIPQRQIKEVISGAVLVEEFKEPVRSFFNIPLVIGDQAAGVLTIAHTQAGLYREEDMTILYKIVQQASRAVTRLQEVVRAEQRKLNAMVSSITEGIVMTDRDYKIVVANPAVLQALGLTNQPELSLFDFIDNLEGKFDIRGKLEQSIRFDKIIPEREVMIRDKFWQIIVAPVKSKNDFNGQEVLGGVVIFHDVTEEKKLTQMREDFTSMMVHELRSPLTGIKKATEFMQTGNINANPQSYGEYVKLINASASEMLSLVNDLLEVAKIEAGGLAVKREEVDVRQLINERVKFYRVIAQDANINLQAVVDDKLPAVVKADPRRLAQIINNFISNGLKFTAAGGKVTVQAMLHQRRQDVRAEGKTLNWEWFLNQGEQSFKDFPAALLLAVTDTGIGVAEAGREQLFNKFKQISNIAAPSEIKGTGLGLSIAKGIVEAHGGVIGVESTEGEGSTFYCLIPI
ncbi:hypothetical protein COU01_02010 [Candidatus Falkowbacteria bacterium CG10_big_fil_rev_8_21_14_0_10_44_15]|uniref:histidine kinase n=1 Tax=Candidatus Falkowbacteria bacterium CG10_big_fil_rev_8_21_14_0_10_44_15 TaxID=1974569 RepID=A0A2H0V009_9BACT|nr:MAG: hypothetical protein COU01_02010 [Candidatus Falkowbacteria bacterium CG10_big_fil_rev_8_21_14_0_10_44_15]